MMIQSVSILGVCISIVDSEHVLDVIKGLVVENGKIQIVTPNPEHVVQALHDPEFLRVLNGADLAVADGVGLLLAQQFHNLKLKIKNYFNISKTPSLYCITGVDLMSDLIQLCGSMGWTVGLVGARDDVRAKLAEKIGAVDCGGHERFKNYELRIANDGMRKLEDKRAENENVECRMQNDKKKHAYFEEKHLHRSREILEKINMNGVDVLFVAYGAPVQEKWIAQYLKEMKSVKIAMGVGGAFDFMAGEAKRAPSVVRKLGFEWLYRLVLEPRRWRRQLRLLEFGWRVLVSSD